MGDALVPRCVEAPYCFLSVHLADARTTVPSKRKLREEKRPACDECRANKLRCDAFLDYSRPCSRCLKKQIDCIVLDERRKKILSDTSPDAPSMSPRNHAMLHSQTSHLVRSSGANPIQPSLSSSLNPPPHFSSTDRLSHVPLDRAFEGGSITEPRTLNVIHVRGSMIDLCFTRYISFLLKQTIIAD